MLHVSDSCTLQDDEEEEQEDGDDASGAPADWDVEDQIAFDKQLQQALRQSLAQRRTAEPNSAKLK
jgi:hypothetical protein